MIKIAIIGAGPAGIYTALFLKNIPAEIDLYEKNDAIGKKLSLTGGGRMNLSNRNFSEKSFFSYEKNILKNIFKKPYAKNILDLFREIGTEYKWEDDRAILASKSAKKEIERLKKMLSAQKNLRILTNHAITKIEIIGEKFHLENQIYDVLIIASGGKVSAGGKGDYDLVLQANHRLTNISPALCPLVSDQNKFRELAGLSLKCILTDVSKKINAKGEMLFTHVGISGPAVLDFSLDYDGGNILLNFLPDTSENDFRKKIEESRHGKIFLKSFLLKFFPKRFVFWQMNLAKIENGKIISDLKKVELKSLIKNIFCFELDGMRKSDFQVSWTSRGGVDLRELSYASLESKLHKNLFFVGEVLDVTGLCGGFNISFAMLSAKIVTEEIKKNFL